MPRWNDTITLIALLPPKGKATDENGFSLPYVEESRFVFANKKSVGYSEFYQSHQAGLKALLKFDVRTADYNGEEWIEHYHKRYKVLRTYESKNGEFVELTVSDLSERGGNDGEL